MVVGYCSANRDESLFTEPDDFDPDRDHLRDHLAFGKGIHFCLGAALSRLEGRVALQELAARLASVSLADVERVQLLPELHAPRPDPPGRRVHVALRVIARQ